MEVVRQAQAAVDVAPQSGLHLLGRKRLPSARVADVREHPLAGRGLRACGEQGQAKDRAHHPLTLPSNRPRR